jgi:hypothetical protein
MDAGGDDDAGFDDAGDYADIFNGGSPDGMPSGVDAVPSDAGFTMASSQVASSGAQGKDNLIHYHNQFCIYVLPTNRLGGACTLLSCRRLLVFQLKEDG